MAAFLGSEADGRELLRPLRRLGPVMDSFAIQEPAGLGDLAMDPREPLPFRSTHALIDELPAAAIEDVARISGPGSSLALVQLRHMGGALEPPRAGRRSAGDAPRRDLHVRPRGRPGRGRGAGRAVRADDALGRGGPAARRRLPELHREPTEHAASSTPRPGSACVA